MHKEISKYLSLILRHRPDLIGLSLDAGGWMSIEEIVMRSEHDLSKSLITEAVARSKKNRFQLSEDGNYIRAFQGHSIPVDLGLAATVPPDMLFHGTGAASVDTIMEQGLKAMDRQYVHLSKDRETARLVGSRHGKPVVLIVAAARLFASGQPFFLSGNGVWLTSAVPPEYLSY